MNKRWFITVIAFLAIAVLLPLQARAAVYKIDPDHTQIVFKVSHLGISSVKGNFNAFEGTFEFDPDNVEAAKAKAAIKASSIDTDNEKRDKHLRSEDFLHAETKPEITFVSKEIKDVKNGGKEFTVIGDLTIRGVTKEVALDTSFGGTATDPWGNERAAFLAETSVDRQDFGVKWNKVLEAGGFVVGDEVDIEIHVQGIKQ